MKYDEFIFDEMIKTNKIPAEGIFTVTDEMKEEYVKLYPLFSGSNGNLTRKEIKFAIKLAGLSFLKLNEFRRETTKFKLVKSNEKTRSGILYIVSNPVFDGYVKIGITKNLLSRMKAYQTCDPFRRFKVEHWKVVKNAKYSEEYLLKNHKIDVAKGEWVLDKNVRELFSKLD